MENLHNNEAHLAQKFTDAVEDCLELDSNENIIGLDMAGVKAAVLSCIRLARRPHAVEVGHTPWVPALEFPPKTYIAEGPGPRVQM